MAPPHISREYAEAARAAVKGADAARSRVRMRVANSADWCASRQLVSISSKALVLAHSLGETGGAQLVEHLLEPARRLNVGGRRRDSLLDGGRGAGRSPPDWRR